MAISNLAIKEINEVNVLTDRVQKRKREYIEAPLWVSSLRAHAITESWKQTEAVPFHLRRAQAFARILNDSPVIIRDGELIVGSETKYIRGAEAVVEFDPSAILNAFEKGQFLRVTELVSAKIEDKEEEHLLEALHYWVGKSLKDFIREA